MSIDTSVSVPDGTGMRVKRTYKLSTEAVATVKRLAEDRTVATTQDGVVELAIQELARRVRDRGDAEQWARAADEPDFVAESEQLDKGLASDEHVAWPV